MQETNYTEQAEKFLAVNGLEFLAVRGNKPARWTPAGHYYRVSIAGNSRIITFDFWDSVHNAEKGITVNAYSVLACLSSDINMPETWADFVSEFGEDSDRATFQRAAKFGRSLREFFTDEEKAQLSEIV